MDTSTSETRSEAYRRVWKEWSLSNPAAIENDAPEWWAAVRAAVDGVEIAKHPGPGGSAKHSTGTDQSEHGKGDGGVATAEPPTEDEVSIEELQQQVDDLRLAQIPDAGVKSRWAESAMGKMRIELQAAGISAPWNTHDEYKQVVATWEAALEYEKNLEIKLAKLEHDLTTRLRAARYSEDVKLPSEWIMTAYEAGDPLAAVPETLPRWTEAAPTHAILTNIDSKMFSGTDGFNENWNRRTQDGLRSVAKTMDEHFGAEIQESFDRFHDEYHSQVEAFADFQWEQYTGIASEGGYDAEGNETWRKYMKPRWIEGQGLIGIHNDEFIHDSRDFRGKDDSLDPDNAWHIRDFVTDTRFVQALESEGIDILTIRPNSRPINNGDLTWEREIARADIRVGLLGDLRELEMDLGYSIESSKDTTSMVDIIQEWDSTEGGAWDSKSHKIAQDLRSRWANSSTDPLSIGVQHAVGELFPSSPDTAHFSPEANDEGWAFYQKFPEVFKGYASSVYAHTQAGFEKMGVTHVPLARGMGAIEGDDLVFEASDSLGDWEKGFDLFDFPAEASPFGSTSLEDRMGASIRKYEGFSIGKTRDTGSVLIFDNKGEHHFTLNPHSDGYKIAWTKDFDYGLTGEVLTSSEDLISYLRSDHPKLLYANSGWNQATVDMQPISSFSTKTDTSRAFAPVYDSDGRGMTHTVLMRATVPVEWIWAHSSDGFGSLKEHEVIVLGDQSLPFDVITAPIGESLPSELIYKALD